MPQAVFDATSVDITAKGKADTYTLRANGNMMKFDGYLKIYGQKFEEKEIPAVAEADALTVVEIKPEQHFTEPPPRFTEARLIKTLEEYGIGRPSTYVPIISVIQSRNYVKKEGGSFLPTEIGEIVNKILTKNFPEIVDINFTATMEEKLDLVAAGNERWQELLQNFYTPFNANLEAKYLSVEKEFEDEKTNEVCACAGKNNSPTSQCTHESACGKPMVIKFGRFGKFLACTGFPDCKNAKPYGQAAPKKIGMKCPKCLNGEVVEKWTRRGRKKMFWGCERYPDCDFASWNNPLEPEPEKKPKAPKATKKEEPESA
jgi:DNA topoisomerase-1